MIKRCGRTSSEAHFGFGSLQLELGRLEPDRGVRILSIFEGRRRPLAAIPTDISKKEWTSGIAPISLHFHGLGGLDHLIAALERLRVSLVEAENKGGKP